MREHLLGYLLGALDGPEHDQVKRELQRARAMPVRSLESYSLLLAAIHGMYRLSYKDFLRSREMLEAVIDRNPRQSVPHAWMGNWHVLNVQQGWSTERAKQNNMAKNFTSRALDLNPDCEYALTFNGLVSANLGVNYEEAESCYDQAVANSPSTSLAWLLKGTLHAYREQSDKAVENAVKGQTLSPLDPHLYYYDCLVGGCYASDGRYEEAYEHLKRSLRLNSQHTSTHRVMTVVQWCLGKEDEARPTGSTEPGTSRTTVGWGSAERTWRPWWTWGLVRRSPVWG